MAIECWVTNELFDAIHRVPAPELNRLRLELPVRANAIASDFNQITNPVGTNRKCVDLLEERDLVL